MLIIGKEYKSPRRQHILELPSPDQLIGLCPDGSERPVQHVQYPAEEPYIWIKYGFALYWAEVLAHVHVRDEMLRLESSSRIPEIYYACKTDRTIYIVMEHIQGARTTREILEADPGRTEEIGSLVASAIQDMLKIPVTPGTAPSRVGGGLMRHSIFLDHECLLEYESVMQMQTHFNEFLRLSRSKAVVQDLEREPMVVCYTDLWPQNFLLDQDGRMVVIDFADVSYLPSSFAKYIFKYGNKFRSDFRFDIDFTSLVDVPMTEGVDNVRALLAVQGRLMMRELMFVSIYEKLFGGDADDEQPEMTDGLNAVEWAKEHLDLVRIDQ